MTAAAGTPLLPDPSRPPLSTSSPTPSISTHTIHTTATPSFALDVLTAVALGVAACSGGYWTWFGLIGAAMWIKVKTGVVLNETILAISGMGLQLSTTRGMLLQSPFTTKPFEIPLSTSRLFLPLASISDVVINEGIYGWTIIYYLVVIQHEGKSGVRLRVGFPELLPRLNELQQVWTGVRKTIFDELDAEEEPSTT